MLKWRLGIVITELCTQAEVTRRRAGLVPDGWPSGSILYGNKQPLRPAKMVFLPSCRCCEYRPLSLLEKKRCVPRRNMPRVRDWQCSDSLKYLCRIINDKNDHVSHNDKFTHKILCCFYESFSIQFFTEYRRVLYKFISTAQKRRVKISRREPNGDSA